MTTHATNRTLVVIDIENLCGGPDNVAVLGKYIRYLYDQLSSPGWMPVIATSGYTIKACPDLWWSWADARRLVRSGPDGADLALIDVLTEPVATQCDRIEIWSGDHIFSAPAKVLAESGHRVIVRGAPGSISRQLRHVATHVSELVELALVASVPAPLAVA